MHQAIQKEESNLAGDSKSGIETAKVRGNKPTARLMFGNNRREVKSQRSDG